MGLSRFVVQEVKRTEVGVFKNSYRKFEVIGERFKAGDRQKSDSAQFLRAS